MRPVCSAFLLCTLMVQLSSLDKTQVTFMGSEYIAYNLKPKPIASFRIHFQLNFRTINPTGLLVYSQGSSGDYIHLQLIEGTLRFHSYVGGKHRALMNLGSNLFDGEWHSVTVIQRDRQTVLKVDDLSTTDLAAGDFKALELDEFIYIGGLGYNTHRYFPKTRILMFKGCLSNVKLNKITFLERARERAVNFIVGGDVVFHCVKEDYTPVTFISTSSFARIVVPASRNDRRGALKIQFKFRTYKEEGLIISRPAVKIQMHLKLKGSSLLLMVIAANSSILLKLGKNLANGNWHQVMINMNGSMVFLQLNEEFAQAKLTNITKAVTNKLYAKSKIKLYVGRGDQHNQASFVGCLLHLQINKHKVQSRQFTRAKYMQGVLSDICKIRNWCFPNKCQNNGKCLQDFGYSRCDCSRIDYEGSRCEIPIFKRTCAQYRDAGLVNDSYCLVRSSARDTKSTFTVLCKTMTKGRTITIVKHSKMKENAIKVQSARIASNLYSHSFHYQASLEQVEKLIDNSLYCKQSVRFDCHRSLMVRAEWVGRNGKNYSYWGRLTIIGSRKICAWSFPDKNLLPVRTLLFHTTGGQSFFNLSALECWGQKYKSVFFPRPRLLYKACVPVEPPPVLSLATLRPPIYTINESLSTTTTTVSTLPAPSLSVSLTSSTSSALAAHKSYFPTMDSKTKVISIKRTTERKPDVKEQIFNKKESTIVLSTTAIVLIACGSFIVVCICIVCLYARRWDDLPLDIYEVPQTPSTKRKNEMLKLTFKKNNESIFNGHIETSISSNQQLTNHFAHGSSHKHSTKRLSNGRSTPGIWIEKQPEKEVNNKTEKNADDVLQVDSDWV